jgi:hypothetical protein
LKEKCDANNNIVTQCVQIVTGGHKQTYGVDYTETFFSVAKMLSICVVFTLAAQLDWELHHVDIKSAYLDTSLDEEVYMMPHCGVLKPNKQG